MSINKIWVVVEPADAGITTTSLELLTKARDLASTVEAVT